MQVRLSGWVRWELLILFLLSPLLLFPNATFGVGMLIVPLLWGLRRLATGRFVVPTPFDIPILILLGMAGIGHLVSSDPTFSLAKIAGIVLGVGTYYAIVGATETKSGWVMPLLLFIGMNLGVAAISLVATAWGNKFPILEPLLAQLPRLIQALPGSPPEGFNPNGVAGLFLFGLPLLVVLTVADHKRIFTSWGKRGLLLRIGITLITLIIGLLFIATQSRAGYISLVVAIGALWLLPRPRWLATALVSAGIVALLFWVSPYRAPLMERLVGSDGTGNPSTLSGRFLLWERAMLALQEFPLTGVGLGMFRFVQPRLYPSYTVPPQSDVGHAHNQFLQVGLDVGMPGLVAYIALWLGATILGLRLLWQARAYPFFPLMLGLLAGWVGYFVWATIETHALGSKGGWFWWWALALIAMTYLQARVAHE